MTVKNGEPVGIEQLFRDLIDALRRMRELRSVVCEHAAPPSDSAGLAKQFQDTVAEIRVLQRQLLRARLTPDQQKQIRDLLSRGGDVEAQ